MFQEWGTIFSPTETGPDVLTAGETMRASILAFRWGGFQMWLRFQRGFLPRANCGKVTDLPTVPTGWVFSLCLLQGARTLPNSTSWEWSLAVQHYVKSSFLPHTIMCCPYDIAKLQHVSCKIFVYEVAGGFKYWYHGSQPPKVLCFKNTLFKLEGLSSKSDSIFQYVPKDARRTSNHISTLTHGMVKNLDISL